MKPRFKVGDAVLYNNDIYIVTDSLSRLNNAYKYSHLVYTIGKNDSIIECIVYEPELKPVSTTIRRLGDI